MPTFNTSKAWSRENLLKATDQWELGPDERIQLEELRDRLADVDHWKNDPFEVARLLRFFRGNMDKVESSVRDTVAWRRDNLVDSFLNNYEPDVLFDHYPSAVLRGVDKDGDPIIVERLGRADLAGFQKTFGSDALFDFVRSSRERFFSRNPEYAEHCWQQTYYEPRYGRRVKHFTVVADMDGLSRHHMRGSLLPVFQKMSRIAQDHYAGTVKRIIILRAPALFKVFWSLVKHLLDPAVRELLVFTTHQDYLQVLDKYIEREVLPSAICPKFGMGRVLPVYRYINLEGGMLSHCSKSYCRLEKEKEAPMDDASERTIATGASSLEVIPEEEGRNQAATQIISATLCKGQWRHTKDGQLQLSFGVHSGISR